MKPIKLTAFLYICDSPFLALLSGTRKRVGSAPQASETVFREGPDDIVCRVSKGACAGNVGGKPKPGGLENWRVQSARARGFTPDAVPTRRKKKEWKQQANAVNEVNSEKKMRKRTGLLDRNS